MVGLVGATMLLLRSSSRATSNDVTVREAVAAQAADRLKKVQEIDDATVRRLAETDDPIDDVCRESQSARAKLAPPGMEIDGHRWNWTGEDLMRWQQAEVVRAGKTTASGENFKTMMQIVVILAVSGVAALFLYRDAASQSSTTIQPLAPAGKLPAVAPKRP